MAAADVPSGIPGRREARERAVQLVYEAEQRSFTPQEIIDDQLVVPDEFTVDLVIGTGEHRSDIDARLDRLIEGWPLDRLASMDRAVLRVATYELGHRLDVPTAVVLNEAIELANSYGTDDSGRFVNGVLAAVAAELRVL